MNIKRLICICFLCLIIFSDSSYAINVHWTLVAPCPDYIVIGTLDKVEHECIKAPGFPNPNREQFMVHDCGWIEVEKILIGKCDVERLPVSWISNIVYSDTPEGERSTHELCEKHDIGDHYIWILWTRYYISKHPRAAYYGFVELPLDSLSNVKKDIARIKEKGDARHVR